MPAAAGAASLGAAGAAETPSSRAIIDLVYFYLRNNADNQRRRLTQFLEKSAVPAMRRMGAGPVGVFSNNIGPDGPFILLVTSYPSLTAMDQMGAKAAADTAYMKEMEAFDNQPGLSYQRIERVLLRGFQSMPNIEVPPGDAKRPGRLFEIRTYESNSTSTLHRKMNMFDQGEIDIFRKVGMVPVFFGETIVGPKMPNLVYMVGYDDLASREKAWRAFGSSPEWAKMRETPGWSDAEIVSNISNFMVSPLPFSQIR
jgi:hypothetical protein